MPVSPPSTRSDILTPASREGTGDLPVGRVLEARMLQQTLLQPRGTESTGREAEPRYQAALVVAGRELTVRSSVPLPPEGTLLRVRLDEAGRLHWVDTASSPRQAPGAQAAHPSQRHSAELSPARAGESSATRAAEVVPGAHRARIASQPGQPPEPNAGALRGQIGRADTAPPQPAPAGGTAATSPRPAPGADWQQAMREALPRQTAPVLLARTLTELFSASARPPLPTAVRALAEAWLRNLPEPQQLQQPSELRRLLASSGHRLEARLRAAAETPGAAPAASDDGKARLLRLHQALTAEQGARGRSAEPPSPGREGMPPLETGPLRSAPPPDFSNPASHAATARDGDTTAQLLRQLLGLVQGSLSRLQVQQLDSLATRQGATPDPSAPHQSWIFELPLRQGPGWDQLAMRIEEYRRREGESWRRTWRVVLDLELTPLGRFGAQLNLGGGQTLSATLWAEREGTHELVRAHLAELRQALEASGARVRLLECRHGTPPGIRDIRAGGILDVRT